MSGLDQPDELMTDDEFEHLLDTLQDTRGATTTPPAGTTLAFEALELDDLEGALPRLRDALDSDGPIAIDLARLERIDTAGLQLLLACRRTAADAGQAFECLDPAEVFIEAATEAGLIETLGITATGTRTDHA